MLDCGATVEDAPLTRRLTVALLFALLALASAGFVRLNRAPLEVDLYSKVVRASAGQALLLAFVAGWLAGIAAALIWVLRLARERNRLERALRLAEGESRPLRATSPSHAR